MKHKQRLTLAGFSALAVSSAVLAAPTITISPSSNSFEKKASEVVEFSINYLKSNPSDTTGLGLKLFFDSSKIKLLEKNNVFMQEKIGEALQVDNNNEDGDETTDKLVNLAWVDANNGWPSTVNEDTKLVDFKFETTAIFSDSTRINFIGKVAPNAVFSADPILVKYKSSFVNHPPTAVNDTVETTKNTAITSLDVLSNDTDQDNDVLSISAFDKQSKQGGVISKAANGKLSYTPKTDFMGSDSFEYSISDGKGGSAQATVNITVKNSSVPLKPVANNDSLTVSKNTSGTVDVLQNDEYDKNASLTMVKFDKKSKKGGIVKQDKKGVFTYTPPKDYTGDDDPETVDDSFTYTILDGKGNTATGTVNIDIGPCFIATAAFGSYLYPEVKTLRNFRDNYLVTNTLGQKFVTLYYKNSPPLAQYIAKRDNLKTVTRWLLTPLVYAIKYPAILLLISLIFLFRKNKIIKQFLNSLLEKVSYRNSNS